MDYVQEYKEAQVSLVAAMASPGILQNWVPPSGLLYKLNFDEAIFTSKKASGVGVVICNAAGEVMATLSLKEDAVEDSEEAEVLALRKALEFVVDVGFSNFIVKGDNVTVMQTVSSTNPNLSRLDVIYEDVRCLVSGL